MDLWLQISPVSDAAAREISAASQEVRDVLERLPGISLQDLVSAAERLGAARPPPP